MFIIDWFRQTWYSLFMTPKQAREYTDALRSLHTGLHAYVDANVPTPAQAIAGIEQRARERRQALR
jgi:hypothetical protein